VENTIHFVVKSVVPVQNACAHCLLGHLTLIHVTWGLVVVQEGDVLRKD